MKLCIDQTLIGMPGITPGRNRYRDRSEETISQPTTKAPRVLETVCSTEIAVLTSKQITALESVKE